MTKDDIMGALPSLSQADLTAVHAVSGSLLGAAVGAVGLTAGPVGQPIFDALTAALGLSMNYASLAPTKHAALFKKRLPDFTNFLNLNFPGWDKNRVTQLAFLRMLFDLVIEDLKKRNVTPSIGMVISNISRVPEVFNDAFPGYLSSGLGPRILQKFQ